MVHNTPASRYTTALILIASQKAPICNRWRQGLKNKFAINEAGHWASLKSQLVQLKPTVILLDGTLLRGHRGLSRISTIAQLAPQSKVILMTPKPNNREGIAALLLGVKGYCSEALPRALMPRLIDRVSDGEVWIGRKLLAAVLDEAATVMRNRAAASAGPPRLTPRERQIGELLANGATNREIALTLNLSEKTVKGYLTALFRKLGVASRLRLGLLLTQLGSSSRRDSRDETELKSMGQEKTLPSR